MTTSVSPKAEEPAEPFLDDLFHGCALIAFVEQACIAGGWPGSDVVRRRAYDLYEQSLSER